MKKLFLIVSVVLIAATLVACAEESVSTASEITNVVPSAATSETTEASEPASTTSQPVVTPPYIVSEPTYLRDGGASLGAVYETEDKIFLGTSSFHEFSWDNVYEYYSKVDGKMHVFCDDPNCDHKNFDGEKFTPKCAACLISDPRVFNGYYDTLVFYNGRVYFSNAGELFSANEDGGDVRLEVSISDKRSAYEELAANPELEKVSGNYIDSHISINNHDGQYIYFTVHYESDNHPEYRFNVISGELVNLDEKLAELGEKVGPLLLIYKRANGKIYVRKYIINEDPYVAALGTRIFEDGIYEITGDFDGIALTKDSFNDLVEFRTEEGTFIRRDDDYNKLILIKEGGEEEVILSDIKAQLGENVLFQYIDSDYIYYVYYPDYAKSLNLSKLFKITTTFVNRNVGKLMRYDRNENRGDTVTSLVTGYKKKDGTKTELKDANGNVYGYSELYDITVGIDPYYFTQIVDGKVEKVLKYESEKTVKDVRGYHYYTVDTSKTQLVTLIDQSTMKQVIDDGKSYNDPSTYYIDPITKQVYLIHGSIVYTTTASDPVFEGYRTSAAENEIYHKNVAVIDNIMNDDFSVYYVDYEAGTAIVKMTVYDLRTATHQNGKTDKYISGFTGVASCDIDGAGNFVNFTWMFTDRGYDDYPKDYEPEGYSVDYNHVTETDDGVYYFSLETRALGQPMKYYNKVSGRLLTLCTDPNCKHVVYDGSEIHLTCPAAMMTDLYGTYPTSVFPQYMDSRFYFVFFQEIYSCDEFGGGLRLEVSMDTERGRYDMLRDMSDPVACEIEDIRISDFYADGGFLYFKYTEKNGMAKYYKFDTFGKVLVDLTEAVDKVENNIGAKILPLEVIDGKIIFVASILSRTTYFSTSNDYKTYEEIDPVPTRLFKTDKGMVTEDFIDGKWKLILVKPGGEKEIIVEDRNAAVGSYSNLLYITNDYIYYYKYENIDLGKYYKMSNVSSQNVSGGKLMRYDLKTGKKTVVIDDIEHDLFEIYSVDSENKTALISMTTLKKDGNNIARTSYELYKCEIDSDGNFISIEKVK